MSSTVVHKSVFYLLRKLQHHCIFLMVLLNNQISYNPGSLVCHSFWRCESGLSVLGVGSAQFPAPQETV